MSKYNGPTWLKPWKLKLWVISLNGVPHNYKSSRAAAYAMAAAYRRNHPHSTWTVKLTNARIILSGDDE